MTQSIEQRFIAAKHIAQESMKKRIQLETKLESVQADKKRLFEKCEQLNVSPEALPDHIAQLEQQLEIKMQELEALLPSDDIERYV